MCERAVLPAEAKSFGPWLSSMCVATSVAVTAITGLQPISAVTLKGTNIFTHCKERGTINHNTRIIKTLETPAGIHVCEVYAIHTSAALLPVLGPSLSNTLGRREGAAGLLVLLVVVLLLSDMVFEFSTVTFRLILDILQD